MEEILEKIARHPEAIESLNKSEVIFKKALKEAIHDNLKLKKTIELHANAPDEYEKE